MPVRGDTFEPGDVVYSGESRGIVVSVDVANAVFSVDWNENLPARCDVHTEGDAVGELTTKRFPWEPVPVAETVALLQRDVAYMVAATAVKVHSNRPELRTVVNTERGQIVPRGECRFTDGTTIEFQDIGMPQIGVPTMTVQDLLTRIWGIARDFGLELER
jgi:hypothetical protein